MEINNAIKIIPYALILIFALGPYIMKKYLLRLQIIECIHCRFNFISDYLLSYSVHLIRLISLAQNHINR